MDKYRIFIRGENFLISHDKVVKRMGFFTTRYIEAENEKDASDKALDMVRDELTDYVQNVKNDHPMLYIEEIIELEDFEGVEMPGRGFSWFPQEVH